jgi:collagenase-like PrtC family protease
MELVAPAGSWKSMVACIEAGADSVYGGLTLWNARFRAENFSLEALHEAVEWCHGFGRRFYLTLNTLVRDAECTAILDLVRERTFPAVDAIIVADMGLIGALRLLRPDVPLHASTQFGAHTEPDFHWLRGHGLQRVVLPREASAEEIRRAARAGIIDVEVFAWGSRCCCFSGDCNLGGVLTGGSGDRGRCVGVCRDVYRQPSGTGQWLYPNDLDIGEHAWGLAEAGVSAIKIEGRRRAPEQLAEVVRRYRAILDVPQETPKLDPCEHRLGWLAGRLDAGHHVRATKGEGATQQRERWSGWKTAEGTGLEVQVQACNASNRFMDLLLSSRCDGTWDIRIARDDGRVVCSRASSGHTAASPQAVLTAMPVTDWGCREIRISNRHMAGLSLDSLRGSLAAATAAQDRIDPLPEVSRPPTDIGPFLRVEVTGLDQALAALAHGADEVIARTQGISDIALFEAEVPRGKLSLKLPLFDWRSEGWLRWVGVIGCARVLATRWSQLPVLAKSGLDFGCDSSVDIWNSDALRVARRFGAHSITSPQDWSLAEACLFSQANSVETDVIIAGRITLGWARLHWETPGDCRDEGRPVVLDDLDIRTSVRAVNRRGGVSELALDSPIPVVGTPADCSNDIAFRYVAVHDSPEEIVSTLRTLRAHRLPMTLWVAKIQKMAGPKCRLLRSAE